MGYNIKAMQGTSSLGKLLVNVRAETGLIPVQDASIQISYSGEPDNVLEQLITNNSGQSQTIELPAPPFEYSQRPGNNQPYSEYNIKITAEGFEPVNISGAEILPDTTAIQNINLRPREVAPEAARYVIPPHTLWGDYPPKIAEAEIKPTDETGEIVLSEVVVPEFVIVHDGPPRDTTAENHYVRYRDYVKNVASSEIYDTWPEETIEANVLAIMSFTLNRVYTEWYVGYHISMVNSNREKLSTMSW